MRVALFEGCLLKPLRSSGRNLTPPHFSFELGHASKHAMVRNSTRIQEGERFFRFRNRGRRKRSNSIASAERQSEGTDLRTSASTVPIPSVLLGDERIGSWELRARRL